MKIKLISIFVFVFCFFLLRSGQVHAQSSVSEVIGGEGTISRQKIEECLAGGGNASTCAHVGKSYMDSPDCGSFCAGGGTIDESNCNEFTCTVTCNNGIKITINLSKPTATVPVCDQSLKGTVCGRNCAVAAGCGKSYVSKYNDKCECVQTTDIEDNPNCTAAFLGISSCSPTVTATTTPTVTATSTPPVSTGTPPVSTGTPPVTTGTPPVTTGTPPVSTPTNPPSPTTPPFSEEMCQCVGLDVTALSPGSPFTVTAKGKVTGTDIPKAKLISFKFLLYKGTDTSSTLLQSEVPTSVTTSADGNTVNYTATWNSTFPTDVTPSVTYRIQALKKCVPKSTAMVDTINTSLPNKVVLGASTKQGFFESIISFINKLLGRENKAATISPTPTQTPTSKTTTSNETTVSNTGDGRKGIQLDNFYPGEITEQSCSFIKFKFAPKN